MFEAGELGRRAEARPSSNKILLEFGKAADEPATRKPDEAGMSFADNGKAAERKVHEAVDYMSLRDHVLYGRK